MDYKCATCGAIGPVEWMAHSFIRFRYDPALRSYDRELVGLCFACKYDPESLGTYGAIAATQAVASRFVGGDRRTRPLRPYYGRSILSSALLFLLGLVPSIGFYLWWAHARFGGWIDNGLQRWYMVDSYRLIAPGDAFGTAHLPINLYTWFFMPWLYGPHWPWLNPNPMGTALLWVTPAFILILAKGELEQGRWRTLVAGAGIASLLGAATVYANGFQQFGPRYLVMIYPMLLALLKDRPIDQLAKALIVASIILCSYGTIYIQLWGFPG